ncbi:unnamed protein product [Musa textilis]
MLGSCLQLGCGHGEDRVCYADKARRSRHSQQRHNQRSPWRSSSTSAAGTYPAPSFASGSSAEAVVSVFGTREQENRAGTEEDTPKTGITSVSSWGPSVAHSCNLKRFLESITPSVPALYPSKMEKRGWRASDQECPPYFALADLWVSFTEWSAYGAGVPLVLSGAGSVVQYYVPYLSGIQLYGESNRPFSDSREHGEESDGDRSQDSSSEGCGDYEHEKGLGCSTEWNSNHVAGTLNLRMDKLCLREKHGHQQKGSSSDDGDFGHFRGHLLFEFLEQDPPFIREPLSEKILDLARCFPGLKSLRSCDLLPSSWISVAWYPIYRIPNGPTLKDLDACFLTFHYLSTLMNDDGGASGPSFSTLQGVNGVPMVSLPVFGLASYKCRGSIWTPNGGTEMQFVNSLMQAADDWVRLQNINHPDYRFFASHGTFRR